MTRVQIRGYSKRLALALVLLALAALAAQADTPATAAAKSATMKANLHVQKWAPRLKDIAQTPFTEGFASTGLTSASLSPRKLEDNGSQLIVRNASVEPYQNDYVVRFPVYATGTNGLLARNPGEVELRLEGLQANASYAVRCNVLELQPGEPWHLKVNHVDQDVLPSPNGDLLFVVVGKAAETSIVEISAPNLITSGTSGWGNLLSPALYGCYVQKLD